MSGGGCSNLGANGVQPDFERSDDDVDSEEEFTDDEADDMMQVELRQICRLGDKAMLKTFLVNNPEIDLDMMDPEAGTTVLNEAATKTAQFAEIVEILLEAGAGLGVVDSLGNTPLHNAVLYYPSTMQTVDLLLEKGADVTAINWDGATPANMADDKDLKIVLKQLTKAAEKKFKAGKKAPGYSGSPHMRKMVFDRKMVEEVERRRIIVKYNSPVVVKSPGLLKRKRVGDDLDESFGGSRKRIRFCEQDSTGADVKPQPQVSDEELATEIKDSEEGDENVDNFVTVLQTSDKSGDTPTNILETDKVIISNVSDSILPEEEPSCSIASSEVDVSNRWGFHVAPLPKPSTCTRQSSILRFFFPK